MCTYRRWRIVVGLALVIGVLGTFVPKALAQEVQFLTPHEGDILRGVVEIQVEGVDFKDLETLGYAVFEYSLKEEVWTLIAVDRVSFDGFSVKWDTTKVPDGTYRLRATITDLWNNTASSQIEVDVDNQRRLRLLQVPADYPTIQEAITQATPRSTILVDARDGPYPPFAVDVPGLRIKSINGRAIIQGREEGPAITIVADRVQLQHFRVEGGMIGIEISGEACVLEDNVIDRSEKAGILLNGLSGGASRNLLKGNTIQGTSNTGIWLLKTRENTLKSNTVRDNGNGIILTGWENTLVGNIIIGNLDQGVSILGVRNTLEGNIIENNHRAGIDLAVGIGGENIITKNEIRGNRVGISISHLPLIEPGVFGLIAFLEIPQGANLINRNNIRGNRHFGLEVLKIEEGVEWLLTEIDARENFWGDPSGPYHPERNPDGRGDQVSDHVRIRPWLTEPVAISYERH